MEVQYTYTHVILEMVSNTHCSLKCVSAILSCRLSLITAMCSANSPEPVLQDSSTELTLLFLRLLVGSPWKGYSQNRKGEIYKCELNKPATSCQALNLQSKQIFPIIPSKIHQKVLSVHRAMS